MIACNKTWDTEADKMWHTMDDILDEPIEESPTIISQLAEEYHVDIKWMYSEKSYDGWAGCGIRNGAPIIVLGLFTNWEWRSLLLSFFHELGHIVSGHLNDLDSKDEYAKEVEAWEKGFDLMKKHGETISLSDVRYSQKCLSTYLPESYKETWMSSFGLNDCW